MTAPVRPQIEWRELLARARAWIKEDGRRALTATLVGFGVGWFLSLLIIAVEGTPGKSVGTFSGNFVDGALFFGIFSTIVSGLVVYGWQVGWGRLRAELAALPRTVWNALNGAGKASWSLVLWAAALALAVSGVLAPAVAGIIGIGLFVAAPSPIAAIAGRLFVRLWVAVLGSLAPVYRDRVQGLTAVFLAMVGSALALVVTWPVSSTTVRLVLAGVAVVGSYVVLYDAGKGKTALLVALAGVGWLAWELVQALPALAQGCCGSEGHHHGLGFNGTSVRLAAAGGLAAAAGSLFGSALGGVIAAAARSGPPPGTRTQSKEATTADYMGAAPPPPDAAPPGDQGTVVADEAPPSAGEEAPPSAGAGSGAGPPPEPPDTRPSDDAPAAGEDSAVVVDEEGAPPPAEDVPGEEPPGDEDSGGVVDEQGAPTDEPPAEEPATGELPGEEDSGGVVDEQGAPTDEPPSEGPPAEEPPTGELPGEEDSGGVVDEQGAPTDEPPSEGPPAEEPPTGELPGEEDSGGVADEGVPGEDEGAAEPPPGDEPSQGPQPPPGEPPADEPAAGPPTAEPDEATADDVPAEPAPDDGVDEGGPADTAPPSEVPEPPQPPPGGEPRVESGDELGERFATGAGSAAGAEAGLDALDAEPPPPPPDLIRDPGAAPPPPPEDAGTGAAVGAAGGAAALEAPPPEPEGIGGAPPPDEPLPGGAYVGAAEGEEALEGDHVWTPLVVGDWVETVLTDAGVLDAGTVGSLGSLVRGSTGAAHVPTGDLIGSTLGGAHVRSIGAAPGGGVQFDLDIEPGTGGAVVVGVQQGRLTAEIGAGVAALVGPGIRLALRRINGALRSQGRRVISLGVEADQITIAAG